MSVNHTSLLNTDSQLNLEIIAPLEEHTKLVAGRLQDMFDLLTKKKTAKNFAGLRLREKLDLGPLSDEQIGGLLYRLVGSDINLEQKCSQYVNTGPSAKAYSMPARFETGSVCTTIKAIMDYLFAAHKEYVEHVKALESDPGLSGQLFKFDVAKQFLTSYYQWGSSLAKTQEYEDMHGFLEPKDPLEWLTGDKVRLQAAKCSAQNMHNPHEYLRALVEHETKIRGAAQPPGWQDRRLAEIEPAPEPIVLEVAAGLLRQDMVQGVQPDVGKDVEDVENVVMLLKGAVLFTQEQDRLQIAALKTRLDSGALTQAEYDEKKASLLA